MDYFERFKKRMETSGNSLHDEQVRNSKLFLDEVFDDDGSCNSKGLFLWEFGISKPILDEKPLDIRIYHRRFSNANGEIVSFQTELNEPILFGDVVYDSIEDSYYICTESFNIDNIHYQGKLTKCNWMLKWQNKNGDILEYPCQDLNSTQYNSGETSNRNFTIGTSQHMLTLPVDDNTILLDSPQRFYLDKNLINPTSYIVTQNDTTSYNYGKGLCKVTVSQYVQVNGSDRPDLGICDYKDTSGNIKPLPVRSQIECSNTIIKSGGSLQTYTAHFFDENGLENFDIIPKWEIVSNFTSELIIEEKENQIRIGIDNDDYIDEHIKLILSDESGSYLTSILLQIDSLL